MSGSFNQFNIRNLKATNFRKFKDFSLDFNLEQR